VAIAKPLIIILTNLIALNVNSEGATARACSAHRSEVSGMQTRLQEAASSNCSSSERDATDDERPLKDSKNTQNRGWHFKDRDIPSKCDRAKGGKGAH
jgi:hypothetical protein